MMDQLQSVRPLLDFIAQYESRGDYNVVWGGIGKTDRPPKPLTQMTVREVLNWQDSIDARYMSEAAGRYQIMEDTLRGLYRPAGVPLGQMFDRETQDRLGLALLRRRGLDDFLEGETSTENFALSLAREWASLPIPYDVTRGDRVLKRGQSYYAGDGLNSAHASVDEFIRVLSNIRGSGRRAPRSSPVESTTNLSVLGGGIAAVSHLSEEVKQGVGSVTEGFGVSAEVALTVVVVGALVWIFRERMRKWFEGER